MAEFCHLQKLHNESNHPRGENSPNLVTQDTAQTDSSNLPQPLRKAVKNEINDFRIMLLERFPVLRRDVSSQSSAAA
jgi:hypothetical protein